MSLGPVLLVTRAMSRPRSEQQRNHEFAAALGATIFETEDGWSSAASGLRLPDLEPFVAVVTLLRSADLLAGPAIDWSGFRGLKVWYEADAHLDYADLRSSGRSPYLGAFGPTFHRHRFDHMIVTGKYSCERLVERGVPTTWIPKGYDPAVFHVLDHDHERAGTCIFGSRYPARAAAYSYLIRSGIDVEYVRIGYLSLNDRLNEFRSCVVCNLVGVPYAGKLGGALRRVFPRALLSVRLGHEVMMKNFEAAAAGCAVFADWIMDLDALGFREGESVVTYRDFDELVEKLRYYEQNADDLVAIADAGAKLCRTRHTWAHRGETVREVIGALAS